MKTVLLITTTLYVGILIGVLLIVHVDNFAEWLLKERK